MPNKDIDALGDKLHNYRKRKEGESKTNEDVKKEEPPPVSAGPILKFLEYTFNASDDKLREVTIIDRRQGQLLPQFDVINTTWENIIEVAAYRKDSDAYKVIYERPCPIEPNLGKIYVKRVAQWQKSIGGMNLKEAVNIALAEMETRVDEENDGYGGKLDPYAGD